MKLEQFLRYEWPKILRKKDKNQMINYYGDFFYDKPSEFEFRPGDKKLIMRLVWHVQMIISNDENGIKYFIKKNASEYNDSTIAASHMSKSCHKNSLFFR